MSGNALLSTPTPSPTPTPTPSEWKEYVPDTTKTAEENATLKAAHDATKPAEPVKPPEAPKPEPITFESLKLPEGTDKSDPHIMRFIEILNNDQFASPSDRGQALLKLQADVLNAVSERANGEWAKTREEWQKEIKADPKLGGERLEATLGSISKLIDQYPDAAKLREAFDVGFGDNPHIIRFLAGLADRLAEGKPTPASIPLPTEKSVAEKMYPSMKQG